VQPDESNEGSQFETVSGKFKSILSQDIPSPGSEGKSSKVSYGVPNEVVQASATE
jgi:hypothetical protein